jgi:hypothetical protein
MLSSTCSFLTAAALSLVLYSPAWSQTYNPTASDPVTGNTAVGTRAVPNNSGKWNVSTGQDALGKLVSGKRNVAVGVGSGRICATCSENVAVGTDALRSSTNTIGNTAIGDTALKSVTTGTLNTAVGWWSMSNLKTGERNIAIGYGAGTAVTGSQNIAIGADGVTGASNTVWIGQPGVHTKMILIDVDVLAKIKELEARIKVLEGN